MDILNPKGWLPPKGYSNGVAAEGRTIFVAGQTGWNAKGEFESDEFASQAHQALTNIVAVLAEAGAEPRHLVRLTWYIIDKQRYAASRLALGKIYRQVIGYHYPAMTLLQVSALLDDRALVEIEATAVLPRAGDAP